MHDGNFLKETFSTGYISNQSLSRFQCLEGPPSALDTLRAYKWFNIMTLAHALVHVVWNAIYDKNII